MRRRAKGVTITSMNQAHGGSLTGEERNVRQLIQHGHDREAVRVATGELVSRGGEQLSSEDGRRRTVPLINVRLIEGVFNERQKRQIIERLTDAMVGVEGENMRKVTWVIIDEVKDGDWGIAGTPMTCASVGEIKEGASAPT